MNDERHAAVEHGLQSHFKSPTKEKREEEVEVCKPNKEEVCQEVRAGGGG